MEIYSKDSKIERVKLNVLRQEKVTFDTEDGKCPHCHRNNDFDIGEDHIKCNLCARIFKKELVK